MAYQESIFFVPVWLNSLEDFVKQLQKDGRWENLPKEDLCPRYLLPYARRISQEEKLFRAFEWKEPQALHIHTFPEERGFGEDPQLFRVRFSCFGTGVGFLEFWMRYKNLTPARVAAFSYLFKKANRAHRKQLPEGERTLFETVKDLLPEGSGAVPFFTDAADFKKECLCFHFLGMENAPGDPEQIRRELSLLGRSYNGAFGDMENAGEYDMVYEPYPYDHWAGSPQGLVNLAWKTGVDQTDYFLEHYKEGQLTIDFYFAYLLLLNQRFSAVAYVDKIAQASGGSQKILDQLNARIVDLKTVYAFNIVSDDRIVQNVYAKMAKILDVGSLLEDLRDNENQMEILQNARAMKAEKLSSKFLFGISLLSLFSALIDASSYFDRVGWLQPIATPLGFLCTFGIVVICMIWLYSSRNQ